MLSRTTNLGAMNTESCSSQVSSNLPSAVLADRGEWLIDGGEWGLAESTPVRPSKPTQRLRAQHLEARVAELRGQPSQGLQIDSPVGGSIRSTRLWNALTAARVRGPPGRRLGPGRTRARPALLHTSQSEQVDHGRPDAAAIHDGRGAVLMKRTVQGRRCSGSSCRLTPMPVVCTVPDGPYRAPIASSRGVDPP